MLLFVKFSQVNAESNKHRTVWIQRPFFQMTNTNATVRFKFCPCCTQWQRARNMNALCITVGRFCFHHRSFSIKTHAYSAFHAYFSTLYVRSCGYSTCVNICNIVCAMCILLALSFTVEIFAEKHISIYCSAAKSSANQIQWQFSRHSTYRNGFPWTLELSLFLPFHRGKKSFQ